MNYRGHFDQQMDPEVQTIIHDNYTRLAPNC